MANKTLLIDNHDSFTHILAHHLEAAGGEVIIKKNDEITLAEIQKMAPTHLVISPGPGHPANPEDFGICSEALRCFSASIPILGVCLGHQGLAQFFGASVVHAPQSMHGKRNLIQHKGNGLFTDLPNPLAVMRYHSLMVDPVTLSDDFEVTATSEDGVIMAIQHRILPLFGVQFHPESVGTEMGMNLIKNFYAISLTRFRKV
jgi:anthranilate synthase/aminodeoxychorismate synthase-like glutamine amidotransferase